VLHPLKVVIDNYPADQKEEFVEWHNPEDAEAARARCPSRASFTSSRTFSRGASAEVLPLSPGKEVRLRNATSYRAERRERCRGNVVEVIAPTIRRAAAAVADGRKVKSTMHWVSAAHAISAKFVFTTNFSQSRPYDLEEGQDALDNLNPTRSKS